ncbi:MAG TPA: DUF488 family protein [Candidatus Limnocylindria bacterium]
MTIRVKRVYEDPAADDGFRVLVDRVWPRGMRREEAHVDAWLREVAPSTELRHWFNHDPARWSEFRERYRAELAGRPGLLEELRSLEREHGTLTLVYSARDTEHNQARALSEIVAG